MTVLLSSLGVTGQELYGKNGPPAIDQMRSAGWNLADINEYNKGESEKYLGTDLWKQKSADFADLYREGKLFIGTEETSKPDSLPHEALEIIAESPLAKLVFFIGEKTKENPAMNAWTDQLVQNVISAFEKRSS